MVFLYQNVHKRLYEYLIFSIFPDVFLPYRLVKVYVLSSIGCSPKVSQGAGLYLKTFICIKAPLPFSLWTFTQFYIIVKLYVVGASLRIAQFLVFLPYLYFYRVLFGAITLFSIQCNLVTKTLKGVPAIWECRKQLIFITYIYNYSLASYINHKFISYGILMKTLYESHNLQCLSIMVFVKPLQHLTVVRLSQKRYELH